MQQSMVDLLSQSQLLSGIDRRSLESLALRLSPSSHAPGEVIFRKGDVGDSMMVVAAGRVKISSVSPRGTEFLFDMIDAGQVFGELALVDRGPRSADATAVKPTELLHLSTEDFHDFLDRTPGAGASVMQVLCARLRHATKLVEETVFLDFPSRLAMRLQELADEYGVPTEQGLLVQHGMSQQELADSIGSTRESVSKQLSVWRDRGLVSVSRGRIVMHAPAALGANRG
jgi:CRP/FNR family cyclic AMP-dependent transcriptional regulator